LTAAASTAARVVDQTRWRHHASARCAGRLWAGAAQVEMVIETGRWRWSLEYLSGLRTTASITVGIYKWPIEEGWLGVGHSHLLRLLLLLLLLMPGSGSSLSIAIALGNGELELALLQLLSRDHLLVGLRHSQQQLFRAHRLWRVSGALHELHQEVGVGLIGSNVSACSAITTNTVSRSDLRWHCRLRRTHQLPLSLFATNNGPVMHHHGQMRIGRNGLQSVFKGKASTRQTTSCILASFATILVELVGRSHVTVPLSLFGLRSHAVTRLHNGMWLICSRHCLTLEALRQPSWTWLMLLLGLLLGLLLSLCAVSLDLQFLQQHLEGLLFSRVRVLCHACAVGR
jgi:hypothetical protein